MVIDVIGCHGRGSDHGQVPARQEPWHPKWSVSDRLAESTKAGSTKVRSTKFILRSDFAGCAGCADAWRVGVDSMYYDAPNPDLQNGNGREHIFFHTVDSGAGTVLRGLSPQSDIRRMDSVCRSTTLKNPISIQCTNSKTLLNSIPLTTHL